MVKLIIFDFDGTIVDSKEITVNIYNQLAIKYQTKKLEDIEQIRKLPLLDRVKALNFPLYKLPLFVAEFGQLYKQSSKNISMVYGVRELLLELRERGYHLAIVSSNSESNIRDYFKENKLDVIDTIISSTNIMGKDKAIKKLLTTHKITASEVIYIGDEIRDVITCKKLEIKIIWVNWGYDLINTIDEHQPDYIVNSPKEILSILP